MKNLIKQFFFLEEEEEGVEEVAPKSTKSKQALAVVEEPAQSQVRQTVKIQNRMKKEKPVLQAVQKAEKAPKQDNVVNFQATASNLNDPKVILIEPRIYAEAQDIAEHLKNNRATIVNLQRIDREQGVRIIDFLSGTVYALGGDIQRIGTDIFLCTPENVEVAGEISDYLFEEI